MRAKLLAQILLVCYAALVVISECQDTGVAVDPVLTRIRTQGVLRVGYDPGTWPFTTMLDNQAAGYDIDLARRVASELGVPVVFVPTGLDAAYDELQQGHFDMIASAMPYAPEQGWRARFSEFYFDDGLMVVTRQTSGADWQSQRVGIVFGSDADTYVRPLVTAGTIVAPWYVDTYDQLWDALYCDRVSAVITEQTHALEMQHADAQVRIGPALTFAPLAMVVSSDAVALNDVINRVLKQSAQDGFQSDLTRRWFPALPVPTCNIP